MPTIARIETIEADGYLRIHSGKAPGARVRVIIEDLDESPSALPLEVVAQEGIGRPDKPSASGNSLRFGGCGAPFDSAHGRPFDSAHGRPFDSAHGKTHGEFIPPTESGFRQPALTEDESSQWAVYSAVTVEDAEEDTLWGKYLHD